MSEPSNLTPPPSTTVSPLRASNEDIPAFDGSTISPALSDNAPTAFDSSHQSQPNSSHNSTSVTGNRLAVSTDDSKARQSFATIAREKTSTVLSNLAVRAKNSSNSLRSIPHTTNPKQASLSTTTTSNRAPPKNGVLSSQSSRETHSSASSVSPEDSEEPIAQKDDSTPQITLDRASVDRRRSNDRISTDRRRLLDRSPSPNPRKDSSSSYRSLPQSKMHQTSSRLLRMTDEERPFTRDFKDLFSTLMVSLPMSPHRVRFTIARVDHTFTSEEAINNLGSLKFSQSNRMPDPKDPSRIVTTTTTTTFSMAKEMARSVCQRFMDARFIEAADQKPVVAFPLKGAVWQLTPKGMHVLQRFCQRNGIVQRHVLDVLESSRNTMQLVILERDETTDKLSHDRATVEVIFRRFVGQDGPNLKANTAVSDSDSVSDYSNGLVGVKMAKERRIGDRIVQNTFTGKAAVEWLMDCCTTVDRRETFEIAELFVQNKLIFAVMEDKVFVHQNPAATKFQPTRNAIYGVTEKGQRVAGWIHRAPSPENEKDANTQKINANRADGRGGPRDSNTNRLTIIVNDAALRLLFREYLRDTHCEENLAFYLEVRDFTRNYDICERAKMFTRLDAIRENLAAAYGLYNAFLAPGSPCELNIDHNLRNNLAGRMTRAVGDDDSMLKSLQEVVGLFKEAQTSVFKLMSSDSVPKFLKEPRYQNVLHEHNFDNQVANVPQHLSTPSNPPTKRGDRAVRDARG